MHDSTVKAKAANPASRWFPYHQPAGSPELRLFCFPFAGGAAALYREWPAKVPAGVEVMAVQFPGRGARLFEEPVRQVDALVRATVAAMLPFLDRPFAFFGYSMGALVAFEAARVLRTRYGLTPERLFLGACREPKRMEVQQLRRHELPLPELIEELERLNGTPKEILKDPATLECFLPALRADFEIVDTYAYRPEAPLESGIHAFGGTNDEIPVTDLSGWADHTTGEFSLEMVDGDHFFILQNTDALLGLMRRELTR